MYLLTGRDRLTKPTSKLWFNYKSRKRNTKVWETNYTTTTLKVTRDNHDGYRHLRQRGPIRWSTDSIHHSPHHLRGLVTGDRWDPSNPSLRIRTSLFRRRIRSGERDDPGRRTKIKGWKHEGPSFPSEFDMTLPLVERIVKRIDEEDLPPPTEFDHRGLTRFPPSSNELHRRQRSNPLILFIQTSGRRQVTPMCSTERQHDKVVRNV